ncbi:hypothetical protein GCM10011408_00310 [Dyella caseinilytica]|nr:hypothetical protein GCM10011408_00310 [Dyella caseinilytica]
MHAKHAMGKVSGVDIDRQRAGAVRHVLRGGYIVGMGGKSDASERGSKDGGGKRLAFQKVLPGGVRPLSQT